MEITEKQRNNIQGDLWSRGFPKFNETYYFFSIVNGKEKIFSQCLKKLAMKTGTTSAESLISNLNTVINDQETVHGTPKNEKKDLANALIAFTKTGLDRVSRPYEHLIAIAYPPRSKLPLGPVLSLSL
jgi:hypothetical protein